MKGYISLSFSAKRVILLYLIIIETIVSIICRKFFLSMSLRSLSPKLASAEARGVSDEAIFI